MPPLATTVTSSLAVGFLNSFGNQQLRQRNQRANRREPMIGNHHQVGTVGDSKFRDRIADAREVRVADFQRVEVGLRAEAAMMLRHVGIVLPENDQRGMAAERRHFGRRQRAPGHDLREVSIARPIDGALTSPAWAAPARVHS